MVQLPVPLVFDWDQGNIEKNWARHEVHDKEAEEVFFNKPLKIFPDTKHSETEKRFLALGVTNKKRQLTIIFTIRKRNLRVISARDQNKKEKSKYEEG